MQAKGLQTSRKRGLLLVSALLASTVVFATQADLTGFPSGHHGWIASHTLANASHTTLSNYGTGYTLDFAATPSDSAQPVYFNRAPFVGTVLIGIPLRFTDRLATQVRLSRGLSNLVIAAALVLILWILVDAGVPAPLALFACLMGFGGEWIHRYRDMTCVDGWSLLGFAMVARAAQLSRAGRAGREVWLLVAAALAVGWGYSALVPLALWAAADLVRDRRRQQRQERLIARIPGVFALVLGVALSVGFVAHTTLAEAAVRDVSVTETGVWESAQKRLGLSSTFNNSTTASRRDAVHILGRRVVKAALPRPAVGLLGESSGRTLTHLPWLIALSLLFGLAVFGIWRTSSALRLPIALLAVGGLGWYVAMPNLSLHHDYVALAVTGTAVVAWLGVAQLWRGGPDVLKWALVALAVVLWTQQGVEFNAAKSVAAQRYNPVTADFQRIADALPVGAPVYFREGYRGVTGEAPYKVGFYLPQHPIVGDVSGADGARVRHHITRHRNAVGTLLTPANKYVFAYEVGPPSVTR